LRERFGSVFAAEETTCNGVVDNNIEAVAAAGDEEFLFDVAGCVLSRISASKEKKLESSR